MSTVLTNANIQSAIALWVSNKTSALATYGDIKFWDLTGVTILGNATKEYGTPFVPSTFNADISRWDVSNVTTMTQLFYGAQSFNADISNWNVSKVTSMYQMFEASSFNADISRWNVSNVTDMFSMFSQATNFNADISAWNVSNVTDMYQLFYFARSFNQNIGGWDVANVTNSFNYFLYEATAFNQDLSKWNVINHPLAPNGFAVGQSTPLDSTFFPVWGSWPSYYINKYHHTFYSIPSADSTVMTRTVYDNTGTLRQSRDISFGGMKISDVLNLIENGGKSPYTVGIVDSSLNKICMDIAYCGVFTKPLTKMQQNKLMTYVNATYKEPHTAASNIYVVTVSGDTFWFAANNGTTTAVAKPTLLLTYGNCYIFDQSHSSNVGNPFTINTNAVNTNRYTTGVVTNGTPGSLNAYTLIDLSSSVAGATLYYGVNGGVTISGGLLYTSALSSYALVGAQSAAICSLFSVTFISSLPSGTVVPYTITVTGSESGLTTVKSNNVVVTGGFFTSPFEVIQFTAVRANVENIISFNISGTVTSSIRLTAPFDTTYCVTWLDSTAYNLADTVDISNIHISDKSPTPKTVYSVIGRITYNSNALKTGYPGLTFAPGGINFTIPPNTFNNGASVFAVYYSTSSGLKGTIVTRTIGSGPYYFDSYNTYRIFQINATNNTQTNTAFSLNTGTGANPSLYSSTLNNTTNLSFTDRRYNATEFVTSTHGYGSMSTRDTASGITIGARDDSTTLSPGPATNGVFSEVIVFNTAVSVTERLKIEGYLAWKWALTPYLLFGHPYKYNFTLPTSPTPIIWYKFDETLGATVTNFGDSGLDGSGNVTNTSAKISYSTTNAKYGVSSLYSSSTTTADNSYLQVPIRYIRSDDFPAGITFSFWIMFETLPTGDTIIMGKTPDTATISAFVCYLKLTTGFQSFNESTSANSAVSINTWYNYVQTYNPTTTIKKTYVNGSLLATKTLAIASLPGATINLVNSKTASYLPLRGWLDDFRIYPAELTSAQVTSIYNNVSI